MNIRLARLGTTTSLVVLASLLVPAAAPAAPTWQADTTVSPTGEAVRESRVALGPTGDAVALWVQDTGSGSLVRSAARPAGGAWSAPVTLTALAPGVLYADVVARPDGSWVALWLRSVGGTSVVETSTRSPAGTWSAPTQLSAPGASAGWATIAVDDAGRVTAVWSRALVVQSSTLSGDAWSPVRDLSAGGAVTTLADVDFDAAGRATVAWTRFQNGGYQVQVSVRDTDGSWSTPANLSPDGEVGYYPQVGVAPGGGAVVAWGNSGYFVRSATRAGATGTWSSPVDLSAANAGLPSLAIDGQGTAYATWARDRGAGDVVEASVRQQGGAWSTPEALTADGVNATSPEVVVTPAGNATLVWGLGVMDPTVVQARTRPTGGTWSSTTDLSNTSGAPVRTPIDASLAPDGDVLVGWRQYDGADTLHARALDVAGPRVTGLSLPTNAQAGAAAAFSVTATDAWSSVASVAWAFGDGSTATGAAASHTYTGPGTYPVAVTVTDAVGNSSTRTGTVVVALARPAVSRLGLRPGTIHLTGPKKDRKAKVTVTVTTASKLTLTFKKKGVKKPLRLTKNLLAGRNTFTLTAKIGKKKRLTVGTWKVTAVATNAAGSSTAKKLTLKVVR
ncbi:PKD domain-containing protein [Nocardioides exalbidus]|uniref:PKD domain-containing protein n=1 Tax=Nocardioides exalbidus TaxID=402596 RepID=A0A1H4JXQ4_9ACTN|nr:PKD domain-containing protein [Nocardioides exalbidus]SEB50625.1 PKD domain-containing protein [Nocardioides exalbidus]